VPANERLEAALAYSRAGWALLPLKGKEPYHALLPQDDAGNARTHLLVDTPATESVIRAWFAADSAVNIGALFRSGARSPLIVDLDPNKRNDEGAYKLPEDRRRVLLDCEGFEPTTLRCRSGSGGWHLYYRHPPAPTRVVSSKGHRKGEGVDVLSGRGRAYVVLPPSVHPDTGERYTWTDATGGVELTPAQAIAAMADLPAWPAWVVHSEIDTRPESAGQVKSWLTAALSTPLVEGGTGPGTGRNTTLRKLALYFASRHIPADVTRQVLLDWTERYCSPPLTSVEVTRQVYGMFAHYAEDCQREATARGETGDQVVLRQVGPAFPFALLDRVPLIRDWVFGMHAERGVSPDLCAAAAIGGLALAATGGYRIRWMRGLPETAAPDQASWTTYPSGWYTTIAHSGARKSVPCAAIMTALGPCTDVLAEVARKFNTARDTRREVLHSAKKRVMTEIDRSAGEVLRIYQEHHARIMRMIAELPPEMAGSWVSSDTTPEALLRKLASTLSVGLYSPECDELFSRMLGHYSGNADLNGMLKAWGGEDIDVDRITRDALTIRGGTISLFAFGQHSVLYGLDDAGNAKDRGFHARMMYAIPRSDVDQPSSDPAILEAARAAQRMFGARLRAIYWGGIARANWASAFAARAQFRPTPVSEPDGEPLEIEETDDKPRGRGRPKAPFRPPPAEELRPPELRTPIDVLVTGEALEMLDAFGSRMRSEGVPGGSMWAIGDWLSKAHEHATRLAVLLQLSERPPIAATQGTDDKPPTVDPITLRAEFAELAIELVEGYYLPHQRVARDIMSRPKETEKAIHALIRFTSDTWKADHFTLQELAEATGVNAQTAKALAKWMSEVGAVLIDDTARNWKLTPLPGIVY
jgi:hypothetical protein